MNTPTNEELLRLCHEAIGRTHPLGIVGTPTVRQTREYTIATALRSLLEKQQAEGLELDLDDMHVKADAFVKTMVKRADGKIKNYYPWWHGWALHDAFIAGVLSQHPQPPTTQEKQDGEKDRVEGVGEPTLRESVQALFDGGFIDAGTREQSEWAQELSRRLEPIRVALSQPTQERAHSLPGGSVVEKLTKAGVFKGAHGLEGLANANEFWENQEYGTRLYYGPNAGDYLHRSVLQAAIKLLSARPNTGDV